MIYLSIAFEWKMAVAAFVALAHDIVITIGVYALAGFQVSPATVIGLLTILGYSLYDTVVVFDKVRENTAGLLATDRSTYSQAANLALNQTLVRSINTSLIALLPVTAILVVAVTYLGTGELQDLSLVLFVGMLSGTYSSICIATPVLADLKEREPQYKQLAKRVALRAVRRPRGRAGRGPRPRRPGHARPGRADGRGPVPRRPGTRACRGRARARRTGRAGRGCGGRRAGRRLRRRPRPTPTPRKPGRASRSRPAGPPRAARIPQLARGPARAAAAAPPVQRGPAPARRARRSGGRRHRAQRPDRPG